MEVPDITFYGVKVNNAYERHACSNYYCDILQYNQITCSVILCGCSFIQNRVKEKVLDVYPSGTIAIILLVSD